jgi:hypothetical protein
LIEMKKKLLMGFIGLTAIISMVGCSSEADTVSQNLSEDADNFQIQRKIVFINGITDKYLLSIEGLCSLDASSSKKVSITCKVGNDQYKKHYLGLSDNVTYMVEQTDAKYEDAYHYKVIFRPETIIPDIDFQTSNSGK